MTEGGHHDALPDDVAPIPTGDDEPLWRQWALDTLPALARSAREAGARRLGDGTWLTDVTLEAAERIRPRDAETLRRHHVGRPDAEIARVLVRNASIGTGTIGAAVGALVTFQQAAPPAWAVIPFELAAETALVVGVELKLTAELNRLADRDLDGDGPAEQAMLLAASWAQKRGVTATTLMGGGDLLSRSARDALARSLRHRLTGRLGRNLATLIPLMAGAAAGAEINRRATRNLGRELVDDLGLA